VLRLGATEKALTEMVAIGEHVVGLTVTSFGLRLEPQLALSGLADVTTNLPDEDEPLDVTIAAWAKDNLGTAGVPAYWQILRPQTKFRQAHWRVHELILGAGELDAKAKGLIALAVASISGQPVLGGVFHPVLHSCPGSVRR